MTCSHCNGVVQKQHNKRTCPLLRGPCVVTDSPNKKVRKPFERLVDCTKMFKEPNSFYTAKKVRKPFENLASCMNIFKDPKGFYTAKKVRRSFDELASCAPVLRKLFKEPVSFYKAQKVVRVSKDAEVFDLKLILDEPIQEDESICEVPALPRPIPDAGTPRIGTDSWIEYLGEQPLEPLQGLADCASLFEEPDPVTQKARSITCSNCLLQGHNIRTCTRTSLVRQFAVLDGVCA